MKAKFLFPIGDVRVAPNSVVEVEIKEADKNNAGFIFPSTEIAERGLVLNNAGLLMGPARAFISNPRDVSINISEKEPIAVAVIFEEGVELEELNTDSEEEDNTPSDSSNEEAVESNAEENAAADEVAAVETDEAPENDSESEAAVETESEEPEAPAEEEAEEPKKGRKGRK